MCIAVTGTERIINCYSHRMLMTKMAILFRKKFTAKKITFAVRSEKLSGSEEDPVIEYVYDCTTEQITKVEK